MGNPQLAFIGRARIDKGMFFGAPLGTELPTKALDELDPLFEDHGTVSENGFSVTPTRSNQVIKDANGEPFVIVQDSYEETIVIEFLEDDNKAVIKTVFGDDNLEVTPATSSAGEQKTIYHTSVPLPVKSWVVTGVSGPKTKTYVVQQGQVMSVAEIKNVYTNVTRHQITLQAFKSTLLEHKGAAVVELRDDGAPTGP